MANLAGKAALPVEKPAVNHYARAHAAAHVEPHIGTHAARRAHPPLGHRRCLRDVVDHHWDPQFVLQGLAQRHILPGQVGRQHAHSGFLVDQARHGRACRRHPRPWDLGRLQGLGHCRAHHLARPRRCISQRRTPAHHPDDAASISHRDPGGAHAEMDAQVGGGGIVEFEQPRRTAPARE